MSLRLRSGSPPVPARAASPRHGPTDSPKEIRLTQPTTNFSDAQLTLEADTSASAPAARPAAPVTPDNPKATRKGLSRRRGRYKKKKVKRDPLKLLPGSQEDLSEEGEARGRQRSLSGDVSHPSRGSSPMSNSEMSDDPSARSSEDAMLRYSEEIRLYGNSRSASSDLEDKVLPAEAGQPGDAPRKLAPSFRGSMERKSEDTQQSGEAMDVEHPVGVPGPQAIAIAQLMAAENDKMSLSDDDNTAERKVDAAMPPPAAAAARPPHEGVNVVESYEDQEDGPASRERKAEASDPAQEGGQEQHQRPRGGMLGVVATEKDVDALKSMVHTLEEYDPNDERRAVQAGVSAAPTQDDQALAHAEGATSPDAGGAAINPPDTPGTQLDKQLDQFFLARESEQGAGVPPLLTRDDEGQPLPLDAQSEASSTMSHPVTPGQVAAAGAVGAAGAAAARRTSASARDMLTAETSGYTASQSQLDGASTERGSSSFGLPADELPESFSRASSSAKSKKKRIVRPSQGSGVVGLEGLLAEDPAKPSEEDGEDEGAAANRSSPQHAFPESFGRADSAREARRRKMIIRPSTGTSEDRDASSTGENSDRASGSNAAGGAEGDDAEETKAKETKPSVLDWLPGASSAPAVRKESNEYKSGEVLVGWDPGTGNGEASTTSRVAEGRTKRASTLDWISEVLRQRKSFVDAPPEDQQGRRGSTAQQKRNSQMSLVTDTSDSVHAVVPPRNGNGEEPRNRKQSVTSSVPTIGEDDLSRWIRNSVELKQQDRDDGIYGRGAIPTDIYGRPLPGYEAFLPNRRGARATQRPYKTREDDDDFPKMFKPPERGDRKDAGGDLDDSIHQPVPSESGKVSIEEVPDIDLSEHLTTRSATARRPDAFGQSTLGASGPARSLPPNLYSDASSDTGSLRGLSRFYQDRQTVVDEEINRRRRMHGVYYIPSSDLIQCYEAIKVDRKMKPNRVTLDAVGQGSFGEEEPEGQGLGRSFDSKLSDTRGGASESKFSEVGDNRPRSRSSQKHLYDMYDNMSEDGTEYSSVSDRTDFVARWLDHMESASMDGDGRYVSVGHLHREKEMLRSSSKRQLQSAAKRFEHDIEHVGRTYGHDNEGVSGRLHELGVLYMATNKWGRAKSCFEQALVFRKQHLLEHHPRIGDTYYNLGVLFKAKRRFMDAAAHFAQASEVYMQCYGDGHEETRDALHNMVECRDRAIGRKKSWFPRFGRDRIDEEDEEDEDDG